MSTGQGKSIPLQEDIDPDYEPSAEGEHLTCLASQQYLRYSIMPAVMVQRSPTTLNG